MSKQQSKQTFNASNTEESTVQNQGAQNNNQLQGILGGYQANASNLFPQINSGYNSLSEAGGGYNPADLSTIDTAYTDLSQGGISPSQLAALTGQAQSSAEAGYKTAWQQMQQQIAATGGYGFTGAAENELARGASQAGSTATNNLLASLVAQQSQNKATGASGLNTLNQGMTANQLQALSGQQGLYNTNVSASTQTLQQILQNFQATGQLSNEDLKILAGIGSEGGAGTYALNALGTAGGVAAGILGAI